MVSDAENKAFHQGTSGINRTLPVLRRAGFSGTADKLEVMMVRLKKLLPLIRDVEMLNETGCCCGEIRGRRTNRDLCEGCEERLGNGGVL